MLINEFLLLGAFLFCIGVYGVIARRNAVLVLMSIEIILNAVNINLVAFSLRNDNVSGQVSRCSSSPSRPPKSASGWRWCCSCIAIVARSPSTSSQR